MRRGKDIETERLAHYSLIDVKLLLVKVALKVRREGEERQKTTLIIKDKSALSCVLPSVSNIDRGCVNGLVRDVSTEKKTAAA